MSVLLQTIVVALLAWAVWSLIRPLFVKSPLDRVAGPPSPSLLAGNLGQLFDADAWGFHDEVATRYGPVVKINAPFGRKWLYVFDPTALQHIVLREQGTYDQIEWLVRSNNMLLGAGLLSVLGETHRKQRRMLMPVFSAKHLRELAPVFWEVANRLVTAISHRANDTPREIDVLDWMGRTALEIIGEAGMGHSFDPLVEDEATDPYTKAAKDYLPLSFTPEMMLVRQLSPILTRLGPPAFRRWIVDHIPIPRTQKLKRVVDVLYDTSVKIVEEKKAAIAKGDYAASKDIMSILLKANMAAEQSDRLPDEQIIGQINTLLFAATDTTSHVMAQVLEMLSRNQDLQEKARRELLEARDGDDIPYDRLMSLPLLDAICKETLRMFPPTPIVMRQAFQDTVLPLSKPMHGNDGSILESVVIPKGTNVLVGVRACNRNKALWGEDADEWKPERWLKPLPKTLEDASVPGVYSNLMTFVGGGRSCIGFSFSQLEMRVVLASLLMNFTFELSDKPIHWNISAITFPSTGKGSMKPEMWLKVGRYNAE
ncbi:cytochrome P450 [Trametes coccinea BRFM310]|uniref:Cytochrome P450 n=1 Tax=Trametes coccinea (strain BRFM310) TaxID=1353009 RepID=A0A1Y2IJV4_TRAC3|nr:cytochrome P450 [Trametes coccinea BRFM310]